MNSDEDTLFNKFFVKDRDSKVSFTVLSDKLNLDNDSLLLFLNSRNLTVNDTHGRKYLMGWKYRDDARTPAQVNNTNQIFSTTQKSTLKPVVEDFDDIQKKKDELEKYRLTQELEEYKRRLRLKNKEIDDYKEAVRRHAREKLELEELHRAKLEELTEKVNLGHSLNERMQSILDRTKRDLERLSGKEVKILILTDFHDTNEPSKRHSRTLFVPKGQEYTFEIGYETKHQNPDLRTHFM
jgi:hypothetical protein